MDFRGNVMSVAMDEPNVPASDTRAHATVDENFSEQFTIVAFWKQNDSDIYGRRQDMLVKYLARQPEIEQIIHFDAPISRESLRRRLNLGHDRNLAEGNLVYTQTLKRALKLADSEKVTRSTFIYEDRRRPGLFPAEQDFIPFVKSVLEEKGVSAERAIFWVWPKYFPFLRIYEELVPGLVVADIVDDHRRWPVGDQYRARLEEHYRDILRVSDIAIANCMPVKEAMQEFGPVVHLVPNAMEIPEEEIDYDEPPEELQSIPRPIIGYVGNLDPLRLDLDLLTYIARNRPEWQLVLIGSVHSGDDVLALRRWSNVHILGVKPYEEVKRYVHHFDVALIPHLKNDLTDAMNPLKAFVYLSLGVPVVSTAIMNIESLGSGLVIADSPKYYVKAIERCLAGERPDASRTRHEMLRQHSWQERVERIMDLIEQGWARKYSSLTIKPASWRPPSEDTWSPPVPARG
jgi:hypothetical protein